MALLHRKPAVLRAKPGRRLDDGAVSASYRRASGTDRTPGTTGPEKKKADRPRAAKGAAGEAAGPEKKKTDRPRAAKGAAVEAAGPEKKKTDRTGAGKPGAGKPGAGKPGGGKAGREKRPAVPARESGRERRRREKQDAVFRDRKRAVSRGIDMSTRLIALLTVLFEAGGLLLAAAHTQGAADDRALVILAVIAPLALLTALVLPRFLPIDPLIMALTNFLCGVGLVILYTVSPERGLRQTVFYVAGLAAMLVASLLVSRLRRFRGLTALAMAAGVVLLALPLLFGEWQSGAKNWVTLPVVGSFQPSELVKLSLVLALAYYFSAHRTVFQMLPAILFAGACLLLLMLQRDLGTALIYYLTTLVMFYAACGNVPLTMVGLAGGAGAAMLGYQMFAHVKVRVAMWRNPWSDPLDKGYQIIQALLAIGSGGLFGVGLGNGTPEKIPAYYNDFIFAVVCEQLGLIFGLLLLAVYALLILRGVSVISRSRRSMDMLLGCGVLAMLGIQTFMIVAGVIKMIPLTGVTMPFLSYGGSSLLSCMMMIGVVHGICARAQEELEEDVLSARG